ncbi:hypothetical protein MOV08_11405 [Streptomyces yunnanensis]|uniref:Uncharacterized protein n=1 Tax=Streptomyces yunnanensis TaxID=156453 RepID=A0ABY8A7V1_9ACTN|nr:hypothetical protein [Streptomyces yunnanensis]WEB39821.1 hypothetical protein MOV08_11405 [Streptomyces yunnanensis]
MRLRTEVLCGRSVSAVVERVAHPGDGFLGAALPSQQMDGLSRDVEAARERAGRPRLLARVSVALGPGPLGRRPGRALPALRTGRRPPPPV